MPNDYDEIPDLMPGQYDPNSPSVGARMHIEQSRFAEEVAWAQIDTARYTKYSMIAVAITSGLTTVAAIATAVIAYLQWVHPHGP